MARHCRVHGLLGKGPATMLSVYDVTQQQVIAQVTVDTKGNAIVAALQVLETVSVAGKVVTGDAMHTQRVLSAQIVAQDGHYL